MVVCIFLFINVLISLKCTVIPFFSSINHFLYWFSLNVRSFNFIAISTQIRSYFSTNAGGMYDLQLFFCEANFSRRNDITCKNVLNRPICNEINKSPLSRVLHVTYFIPCSKKPISPYITKTSKNTTFPMRFISEIGTVTPQILLF